jgi:Helitron helicase-like domain at N-terminus
MDPNQVKTNIDEKILKWHHKTSNGNYQPVVCIICDQFILPNYRKYLSLADLDKHQQLFYPDPEYGLSEEILQCYRISLPDVEISQEVRNSLQIEFCLLSSRSSYNILSNQEDGFDICKNCHQCLSRKQRPKFCIANNFCFGEPPTCLLELTDVERAVITPVKTHGFCFCYTGGQKVKLQGSLSYYKVDTSVILQSIAHLKAVQANIVVVVYGNVTRKQYKLAQQKSKIRIDKIVDALRWLLQHNKQWKSMNVTESEYDELIITIRSLNISEIKYKLHITFDEDPIIESEELFHVYYPDDSINKGTGGQINIEELQQIVHESNVNHHDIACRFDLLKESVRDYRDENLVNACLLQFPYGYGGMHEKRKTLTGKITESIDIQLYIEYLSRISLSQFHNGLFTLILYNMMTVQSMVRTARWQLRNKIDATMLATELTYEDVEEAINATKVARGIYTDTGERGQQTLRAIDAICNAAPHSNDAAKKAKFKAQAIHHYYGCPTLFLTVTPDDDNHFSIQVLSGENIDINGKSVHESSDEDLMSRAQKRTKLRLKVPGICALFFELALDTVISEVLGWDIELNCSNSRGLFGKIDAFTCSIEEQGRSTLHAHFLIWIVEKNLLREQLHNDETYQHASGHIKHLVDRVSSSTGFFNDTKLLRDRNILQGRTRKRFLHDCSNGHFKLPNFPTDEQLLLLRKWNSTEPMFIFCNLCGKKWSNTSLQDCYLIEFLKVPNFSTITNENKVRRLKATAIEYQLNDENDDICNYSVDFGYNMHNHTASCFKLQKNKNNKEFKNGKCSCRYRYPQKKGIIQ